ncbi:MAG: sulfite exporter TauE/SafE family protein [Alphaproteobacteria bacterium]|nr:sulfite exporter TauE/SafE family protein [Alphaproteobacteria bacterium]
MLPVAHDFRPFAHPYSTAMDFLGTPDVGPLLFAGLVVASCVTAFIGVFTGAAGGVVLLGLMAMALPPLALIPVHTVVMLGSGVTRTMIMWRNVMRGTLLPFVIGSAIGAAAGAKIFIALSVTWLQFILGAFILLVTWMPNLGRIGAERGRFAVLGFATTFVGVFVSATGTLLAPFVAASTPDRRVHVATMGALMVIAHVAKLVAFGFIGFAIASYVPLMAAMIASGAVGNWIGEVALNRVSEQRFRLVLQIVLTLLGLRLLWGAARGAGWF